MPPRFAPRAVRAAAAAVRPRCFSDAVPLSRSSAPLRVSRVRVDSPFSSGRRSLSSSVPASSQSKPNDGDDDAVRATDRNAPAVTDRIVDLAVAAKIEGEESQIVTVNLRPNEVLRAESGAMLFMTQGVEMNTQLQGASSAFRRMMTGQNVFLTDYVYTGTDGVGTVALGTDFPSKILRLSLSDYHDSTLICQRGAFLASNPTVSIDMEFTKSLSAGFFGGQGFILQRLSGSGDVLVKGGGTIVEKELASNETIRVTSGSIVAFTSTVDYDVQMMPGIKNVMFGGEGLFVTKLTGPGKVWMQGMPPDRMIAEIARRVPAGGGIGLGIPVGGSSAGSSGDGSDTESSETAAGDSEDAVAATDAAVDADRQATVASSGMAGDSVDSESPSALFGDAAPPSTDSTIPSDGTTFGDDRFGADPNFGGDNDDNTSFSTDTQPADEWDGFDSTETEGLGEAGEEATEAGGGLLNLLWDLFRGDD